MPRLAALPHFAEEVRRIRELLPQDAGVGQRSRGGDTASTREHIQVLCRVRDQSSPERRRGGRAVWGLDDRGVAALDGSSLSFRYDRVFGPATSQADVYAPIEPLIRDVLNGVNGAVLCYGQTSAGKTFTMEGLGDVAAGDLRGIIPRSLATLFGAVERLGAVGESCRLHLSMYEIYMEKLRDLLNPEGSADLRIAEDRYRGVVVRGLREVVVTSFEQALDVFHCGRQHRAVGATGMNDRSSRSHSIFVLRVERAGRSTRPIFGKLCLVDLAGSECLKKACLRGADTDTVAANAEIAEESKAINTSLSVLSLVVSRLADRRRSGGDTHVPYRSSKLTHVLKDVIGGASRTVLVVNCSISSLHVVETTSTLRFGARARAVVSAPGGGHCSEGSLLLQTLIAARREIERLRSEGCLPGPHAGATVPLVSPRRALFPFSELEGQCPLSPIRRLPRFSLGFDRLRRASMASTCRDGSVSPLELSPRSALPSSRRVSMHCEASRAASRSRRVSLAMSERGGGARCAVSPLELSPRSGRTSRRVSTMSRRASLVEPEDDDEEDEGIATGGSALDGEDRANRSICVSTTWPWEYPLAKQEMLQRAMQISAWEVEKLQEQVDHDNERIRDLEQHCAALQAENEFLHADRANYIEHAVRSSFEDSMQNTPARSMSAALLLGSRPSHDAEPRRGPRCSATEDEALEEEEPQSAEGQVALLRTALEAKAQDAERLQTEVGALEEDLQRLQGLLSEELGRSAQLQAQLEAQGQPQEQLLRTQLDEEQRISAQARAGVALAQGELFVMRTELEAAKVELEETRREADLLREEIGGLATECEGLRVEADSSRDAAVKAERLRLEALHDASLDKVREEAEASHAVSLARLREEAKEQATSLEAAHTASLAKVREEAEAGYTTELAKVREEAEAVRVASLKEAEAIRQEAEASHTASLSKVREEAEASRLALLKQAEDRARQEAEAAEASHAASLAKFREEAEASRQASLQQAEDRARQEAEAAEASHAASLAKVREEAEASRQASLKQAEDRARQEAEAAEASRQASLKQAEDRARQQAEAAEEASASKRLAEEAQAELVAKVAEHERAAGGAERFHTEELQRLQREHAEAARSAAAELEAAKHCAASLQEEHDVNMKRATQEANAAKRALASMQAELDARAADSQRAKSDSELKATELRRLEEESCRSKEELQQVKEALMASEAELKEAQSTAAAQTKGQESAVAELRAALHSSAEECRRLTDREADQEAELSRARQEATEVQSKLAALEAECDARPSREESEGALQCLRDEHAAALQRAEEEASAAKRTAAALRVELDAREAAAEGLAEAAGKAQSRLAEEAANSQQTLNGPSCRWCLVIFLSAAVALASGLGAGIHIGHQGEQLQQWRQVPPQRAPAVFWELPEGQRGRYDPVGLSAAPWDLQHEGTTPWGPSHPAGMPAGMGDAALLGNTPRSAVSWALMAVAGAVFRYIF